MRFWSLILGGCLAATCLCSNASAQWGDFEATFTLTGAAPKLPKLAITDPFCVKEVAKDPALAQDETYVVGPNKELKNVLVSLSPEKGQEVKVHASYDKDAKATILLDNQKCRFEPRITILRTSQTLKVGNSDTIGHNSNFGTFANPPQNVLIPAGGSQDMPLFKEAEKSPIPVSCNIHAWMRASVVIKTDPYAAVSDATGKVTLKNLPEGKWLLHIWHEGPGNIASATLDGKKVEWKRGRAPVEIANGKTVSWKVELTPDQVTPKSGK